MPSTPYGWSSWRCGRSGAGQGRRARRVGRAVRPGQRVQGVGARSVRRTRAGRAMWAGCRSSWWTAWCERREMRRMLEDRARAADANNDPLDEAPELERTWRAYVRRPSATTRRRVYADSYSGRTAVGGEAHRFGSIQLGKLATRIRAHMTPYGCCRAERGRPDGAVDHHGHGQRGSCLGLAVRRERRAWGNRITKTTPASTSATFMVSPSVADGPDPQAG